MRCSTTRSRVRNIDPEKQLSNTNSASQNAPGQQMQNNTTGSTTSPGASSYAPGQKMQNDTTGSVTGQGASSYAPGQQKKLPTDSTGTTTQRK